MKETAKQSLHYLSVYVFGDAFFCFYLQFFYGWRYFNENKVGEGGSGVACILFPDIFTRKFQSCKSDENCLKYLIFVFNLVLDAEFKRWRGCHAAPGPVGGAVLQAAAAAVRHPGRGAAVRGAAADDSAAEFAEANDRWARFTDILYLHDRLQLLFHAYAMALYAQVILENQLWRFYSDAIFQNTRMS